MAFLKSISVGFVFSFLQCYLILADDKPCGQHDVKVNYLRNCAEPKNQFLKIHNITINLTDDCKLVPRGCFKIKKSLAKGKVDYYVNKPPFKKKGTEDFCSMLDSPNTQKAMEVYKPVPSKCTFPAGDYCFTKGNTKIEKLNQNALNLLAGTSTGYLNIENEETGDKACVEFKLTITKKG